MSCDEVGCYKCGGELHTVCGNYYCRNGPDCSEGCECHSHECSAVDNPIN
jgi:hypothetical protein